jgi:OOP family OmpA-OmpF porin
MKYISLIALFLLNTNLFAQNIAPIAKVEWANEVLQFSSQFDYKAAPGSYEAEQALGPPSITPDFGSSPCAWAPGKENSNVTEFIEVGFANAIPVKQVIIHENFNPNAISKILLIDEAGENHKVFKQIPSAIRPKNQESGRLFIHKLDEITPYKVKGLRLELMTTAVAGYNTIDAIGISSDDTNYEIPINTVRAAQQIEDPENLGEAINSRAVEMAPIIAPDDQTLYFTRQKHPDNINPGRQDIWVAKKDSNGLFGIAKNMGKPINSANNNALCSVSPDGQSVLLLNKYLPNGLSDRGLSISLKTKDGWSFPEAVEVEDYYNDNKYGEYFLANDGKTLLMAVQRKDAIGSKDIYVCFRKANGSFSKPKNLGPVVNTADSEVSPFLAADGRTLYFATGGYPGYGNKDMFVSRRLDDSWTNWSTPENLGPKLNGNSFDAYYSVSAKGDYAYFSSASLDGLNQDIYRVALPEAARPKPVVLVYGKVIDAKTKEPMQAEIRYESFASGKEVGQANSDPLNGDYSIVLASGDSYGFRAAKAGYLAVSQNINLEEVDGYKKVRVDLELAPIEKGAVIRLNNIFFDPSKYDLKERDELELQRVVNLLKVYPNMEIEISGHTDNVGSNQSNMVLSQNRAKSVRDFLENKGIESSRLQSKGYGESSPQADNSSAEGRALNRRIELKILKVE